MANSQEERKSTHANPMMTKVGLIKDFKVAIVTMLPGVKVNTVEMNENIVLSREKLL